MNSSFQNIAIGVDIGGSHITAVTVDMEKHRIISGSRVESPVDNKAEADEILSVWTDTLKKVRRAGKDVLRESGQNCFSRHPSLPSLP